MEKIKKREKGITLIALVVTIIVLLLLAGVSIQMLTGQNGILKRAKESERNTNKESLREQIQLELMDTYNEDGYDTEKLKEKLKKDYNVDGNDILDTEEGGFTFPLDGYIVKVEKDEKGVPKVEIEGDGNRENLPIPPTLLGSDTKIEFDPSDWTNTGVKVIITLDEKIDKGGSVLQYSIDEGKTWNAYRNPFEIVENNTVIIARLYNGVNESSGYATATILKIDKLPPKILNVEETHTTSTIILNVIAEEKGTETDGESGINRYYFMVDNSGKWEPEEGSTSPQYTFDKLKQNKEYSFKVKVTDLAKNETTKEEGIKVTTKGLGNLGDQTSNTVINFSPDDWTAEGVQVTITTGAEISGETRLQYSIDEGVSWIDYNDTPFMVYENETVIIARLYDGTNESGHATAQVTKIDKVAPTVPKIEIETGAVLGNDSWYRSDVTIKITEGTDNESGVEKTTYVITGAQETAEIEGKEVKITKEGKSYITAYTYDKVGNKKGSRQIEIKKDTKAPTLTLRQIDTTTKEYSKEVEAIATDETSNIQIKKYAYKEKGKEYFTTGGTVIDSDNITLKSEDLENEVRNGTEYKYTFYAKDNAGNETIKTIELQNILLDIILNGLNGICVIPEYASIDQSTGEVTTENGAYGPYWTFQKGRYKITYYGENLPIIPSKYYFRSLYDPEGAVNYPVTVNSNINPNEVSYEVTVDRPTKSCELMLGAPGADASQNIKIKNIRIIQLD